MGKILRIALLFVSVMLCLFARGQNSGTLIKGTITDDKGVTLPGVTVTAVGGKANAITDIDGKYAIRVPEGTTALNFSFVSMAPQTISINAKTIINVSLKASTTALNDVVVIGYGAVRRADITSSVSSVSEKDIKNLPVAGVDQAIQGKVAGVTVSTNGGTPGGGVSVRVRGITSINGNEPLYVIDGVPLLQSRNSIAQDQLGGNAGQTAQSPLASLNPSDIASVDILKDASAQAIYGSRGANGVVLITTKRGRAGEGKITYDVYYGRQNVQKKLDIMDLSQFAEYQNQIQQEAATVNGAAYFPIGEFQNPSVLGKGTNWQDAIFQTGIIQNHQLSFSGGQDKTNYFLSLNYFNQSGTIIGSGMDRYSLRLNLDHQIKSWFKVGLSSNLTRSNQKITLTNGSDAVVALAVNNSPAAPVYNGSDFATPITIGGYNFGNVANPVAYATLRDVHNIQYKGYANVYGEIAFTKHLNLRNEAQFDFTDAVNSAYQPYADKILSPSRLIEQRGTGIFWSVRNYLNYNQSFGKHNVTAQLGHEVQYSLYDDVSASRQNLIPGFQVLNAGETANQSLNGNKYVNTLESYFARVGYTFNDRYSVNLTGRRDGSSTFGPNRKYGYFPAVSVGWTVTNENFAKDLKTLNYLKLRLGAGDVGNQNFLGQNSYSTNIRLFSISPFGAGGFPQNVGNPNYQWESIRTYNGGFDATLFNRKIELTVDVYKKITTNMLMATVLPKYTGIFTPETAYKDIVAPIVNAGKMTNTGIDIGLTSYNISNKDFSWKTNAVFSHYKNKLIQLNNESAALYTYTGYSNAITLTKTAPGQPVGQFFGFMTDGLFKSVEEIQNSAKQGLDVGPKGTYIGDVKFKDLNDDGVIDDKDQTYIGNPNPKFTYGITNTFSYKRLDFSFFFQGSYGSKILNYTKVITESLNNRYNNQLTEVLSNRYSASNPNGTIPRYNEWHQQNFRVSDRFVESGSYLRLQNVAIGYNLPEKWVKKVKMSAARIYASGQNLYTFTKYSGYDPELGSYNQNALQTNVDIGNYPNPRTVTIGANITF